MTDNRLFKCQENQRLFDFYHKYKFFRIIDGNMERYNVNDKVWKKSDEYKPCTDGHIQIGIYIPELKKSVQFYWHRIVWRIHYGFWPNGIIDHIDNNPLNNSVYNLRDVSAVVNSCNRASLARKLPGVTYDKKNKKWMAKSHIGKVIKFLGRFDSQHEAYLAYKKYVLSLGFGNMTEILRLEDE